MMNRRNIAWLPASFITIVPGLCLFATSLLHAQTRPISLLAAVQQALDKNASILISQKNVDISEAGWESASSRFDLQFFSGLETSRNNTPLTIAQQANNISVLTRDVTSYQIGLSRLLRSGIQLSSEVSLLRQTDQFNNSTSPNYAEVALTATVPLLQGRGSKTTAAGEKAAAISFQATKRGLEYSVSRNIYSVTLAYWSYAAASERLVVLQQSERRAEKILQDTRVLIEAGERPSADIKQTKANLADKRSTRILGEQAVLEAARQLALAMGLSFPEKAGFDMTSDAIPTVATPPLPSVEEDGDFIEAALRRRADYLAAGDDVQAAVVLRDAAVANNRPQLDLAFSAGYSGLDEGTATNQFFTPFRQNLTGANLSAGLNFVLPTGSRRAAMLQQEASFQQEGISRTNLEHSVRAAVHLSLENLRRSFERVQQTGLSIEMYQAAIEAEEKKLAQNLSTIIDLIFVEDRLTSALLNGISARLSMANAIVNLRFETGTLVKEKAGRFVVTPEQLLNIPTLKEIQ